MPAMTTVRRSWTIVVPTPPAFAATQSRLLDVGLDPGRGAIRDRR